MLHIDTCPAYLSTPVTHLYSHLPVLLSLPVCLSTVDRRSRERFVDSNNQIAALVEKFKLEGGPYRKSSGPPPDLEHLEHKVPLSAYGRPGVFSTMMALLGYALEGGEGGLEVVCQFVKERMKRTGYGKGRNGF